MRRTNCPRVKATKKKAVVGDRNRDVVDSVVGRFIGGASTSRAMSGLVSDSMMGRAICD